MIEISITNVSNNIEKDHVAKPRIVSELAQDTISTLSLYRYSLPLY
jgi:hypothetical protein